jgi:hypothetical protein
MQGKEEDYSGHEMESDEEGMEDKIQIENYLEMGENKNPDKKEIAVLIENMSFSGDDLSGDSLEYNNEEEGGESSPQRGRGG